MVGQWAALWGEGVGGYIPHIYMYGFEGKSAGRQGHTVHAQTELGVASLCSHGWSRCVHPTHQWCCLLRCTCPAGKLKEFKAYMESEGAARQDIKALREEVEALANSFPMPGL